jgi:dTDP-glucose pyrophosphorylase
MNIVIPMAGRGSRFSEANFQMPKPLIEIQGKPMIEWAVKSLNLDGRYIFIVQKSHLKDFGLEMYLRKIVPDCKIVPIDYTTEGQACSVLLAEPWINTNESLVSANCDQVMEWNSSEFLLECASNVRGTKVLYVDGVIPTFEDPTLSPKWSYAKTDKHGIITDVAEKNPISTHATTGVYHWNYGEDFVKYAKQMIAQDLRINNEFYSCPVYKEAIQDGLKFRIFDSKVHTTGTPEELNAFLKTL